MSKTFSADQYDDAFSAKRLGNWQAATAVRPTTATLATPLGTTSFGTLKARTKTTSFIVDNNGHLLPNVPSKKNAFVPIHDAATGPNVPRWPEHNTTINTGGSATMGYKGIQTNYLPSSSNFVPTVLLKTGEREVKFT